MKRLIENTKKSKDFLFRLFQTDILRCLILAGVIGFYGFIALK